MTVPVATLGIERHLTNPPKPTGIGVFSDDRKLVALITLEEFRGCYARLEQMEAARKIGVE